MSQLKDQQTGASGDNFTVGGNLTVTGTTTLTTVLPVASGGTGASTAANARTSLSAAGSGANSDITSITGLTTALAVSQGGTGAATHTSKGVLIGNGTSAVTTVSPSTSGNVLVSDGTSWTSSTYPAAKAWVNFNGTTSSPSTIRSSYNITSVTKTGTGRYNLNFTTAMADTNYVVVSFAKDSYISLLGGAGIDSTSTPTTTAYARVSSVDGGGSYYDYTYMMFVIFGN
jgi:hypothetical protein